MNKKTKIFGSVSLALLMGLGLAGCGVQPLFSNNFSKGNAGTFVASEGLIVDNADKTITINKETDNSGANTVFKEAEKNFAWVDGGYVVTISMKLNPADYELGKGFTWSMALNNSIKTTDEKYQYITEGFMHFRKYADGIRIAGVGGDGADESINASKTENSTAVISKAGTYAMSYKFYANKADENKILIDQKVVNVEENLEVYANNNVGLKDGTGADVKESNIAGLRYAWLPFMSANSITVNSITIFKNAK
ncbi:MAG: hypothetical protein RR400_02605 [Clostridia bacterium]